MRWIPVNTDAFPFLGTGTGAAKAEYVQLGAPGDPAQKRVRSGNQETDKDSGLPLWVLDVIVQDPDSGRTEVVGVKVAAAVQPETVFGQPVRFLNLRCMGYVSGNFVQYTFRADGVDVEIRREAA